MEYKKVKNSTKPGRPPSGCVWVKDDEGNIVTNDKKEVAYREATPADLAKKKSSSKKGGRKKKTGSRGRKAVNLSDDQKKALFLKKTYKDFSAAELEKIRDIADSMIQSVKEEERNTIEKQIDKLKNKLQKLT